MTLGVGALHSTQWSFRCRRPVVAVAVLLAAAVTTIPAANAQREFGLGQFSVAGWTVDELSPDRIVVVCSGNTARPQRLACEAVQGELKRRLPGTNVVVTDGLPAANPDALTLVVEVTRVTEFLVEARLVCLALTQDNQPRRSEGPLVEVSSSDAPLRDNAFVSLAAGLLDITRCIVD